MIYFLLCVSIFWKKPCYVICSFYFQKRGETFFGKHVKCVSSFTGCEEAHLSNQLNILSTQQAGRSAAGASLWQIYRVVYTLSADLGHCQLLSAWVFRGVSMYFMFCFFCWFVLLAAV